jgi:FKBP-type peptidyl-prolyl cis-trans isomerase FklB
MEPLSTQATLLAPDTAPRFAVKTKQWDNKSMTKLSIVFTAFMAMDLVSAGAALAQQSSTSGSQQAPAATAPAKPATGAQSSTAPKSGQTPAAKRPATTPAAPLTTPKQKASYAIGMNIGKGLKKDEVDVDGASLARGIRDAIAGNKPLLTDEESKTALMALATEVRAKQQAKLDQIAVVNKKEGEAFLAANKAKDGVVALPSGLQYKIEKEGNGPKPTAADSVTCNYRGTLIDGKEFDSSYKRGQPLTIPVSGVIKGWTEAMQLMPVGSKWQLFIPPDLGYGNQAMGQDIQPGSTLIFEVELLSIAPKAEIMPGAKPEAAKPDTKPSSN